VAVINGDKGCQESGYGDGCEEPQRADKRAHELFGDKLDVDNKTIIDIVKRKQQQHGQGRAGISQEERVDRSGDMVFADVHGRAKQGHEFKIGFVAVKLENCCRLRDDQVIQDAQGSDEDASKEQTAHIELIAGQLGDIKNIFIPEAGHAG